MFRRAIRIVNRSASGARSFQRIFVFQVSFMNFLVVFFNLMRVVIFQVDDASRMPRFQANANFYDFFGYLNYFFLCVFL